MGIRKISLIIGIAVAILGLNYLLNLYNEKFVDVNSKDYIIEQFTKENIGNKKYFKQHGNVWIYSQGVPLCLTDLILKAKFIEL